MKILLAHPDPFLLAHGGFQVQIEATARALGEAGAEVEMLRWWDERQTGDIIHYFGRPHPDHVAMAQKKGLRFVFTELLTSQGSRSDAALSFQEMVGRFVRGFLPFLAGKTGWESYQLADAIIALTRWEAELMSRLYGADESRIEIVPNGVDTPFFQEASAADLAGKTHLLCVATITERKRIVELAEAAILAQAPLVVIGKPYANEDPYYLRFLKVIKMSAGIVRYDGPIGNRRDLATAYGNARGFVLLSTMESQSLSALEAAASSRPLLLSDLPWAHSTFGNTAVYCDHCADTEKTAEALRGFFAGAPKLIRPEKPQTWRQVADRLLGIYVRILSK